MPFAIDLGTTVEVIVDQTGVLFAQSTMYPGDAHQRRVGDLAQPQSGWAAYVDGAVHLLRQQGVQIDGVTVHVDSDIPPGAGLSSSAALVCAVLCALLEATGHEIGQPGSRSLGPTR